MKDENQVPALYVYNYQDSGCLVLSAEYKHEPICAYLDKSSITEYDSVPGPLVEWFGKTVENIQIVRDGDYDNTARANAAWYDLLAQVDLSQYNEQYRVAPIDPPPPNCEEGWVSTVVGPLLPTTWGQGCSYNNLCPSRNCTNICFNNPSAWTGCVATSMAQVIRYWQPNNSYNYNYASMPNASGNAEVQRLMRDAGRNVAMDYGCGGSSADGSLVPTALKGGYLWYPFSVPGYGFTSADRSSYGVSSYITVVNNLTHRWPVLL